MFDGCISLNIIVVIYTGRSYLRWNSAAGVFAAAARLFTTPTRIFSTAACPTKRSQDNCPYKVSLSVQLSKKSHNFLSSPPGGTFKYFFLRGSYKATLKRRTISVKRLATPLIQTDILLILYKDWMFLCQYVHVSVCIKSVCIVFYRSLGFICLNILIQTYLFLLWIICNHL